MTEALARTAGIGLRHPHMTAFAGEDAGAPRTAPWLEIHSENFLCEGGPRLAMLDAIAARYPISCHGVGLSLGSAEGIDARHLSALKNLFARVAPVLVSEHLSWSVTGGAYLNDLLPLPYMEATLAVMSANVAHAQDAFGRKILIENPSAYLSFAGSTMTEAEFLRELVERTGCGLLLDVNNVFVSATNLGYDAQAYLDALPLDAVGEIHVAGHSVQDDGTARVLVDTHSTRVCEPVWGLYRHVLARSGPRPTLIEWDLEIPELSVLLKEAKCAQGMLDGCAKADVYVA